MNIAPFTRKDLLLVLLLQQTRKRKSINQIDKQKKKMLVRKVFADRKIKGNPLIGNLNLHDQEVFFKYFRMILTRYEELLGHVSPLIAKSNQRRESIKSNQQSFVILRYIQPRSRIFQDSNFLPFSLWWKFALRTSLRYLVTRSLRFSTNFLHCAGTIDEEHVMQVPFSVCLKFYLVYKDHFNLSLLACKLRARLRLWILRIQIVQSWSIFKIVHNITKKSKIVHTITKSLRREFLTISWRREFLTIAYPEWEE